MELLPTILFSVWLVIGALSVVANRDLLSPAKFFHLYLGVYFGDMFFQDHHADTVLLYVGLLTLSAVIATFEWVQVCEAQRRRAGQDLASDRPAVAMPEIQNRAFWLIWLATLGPIASLAYLIYDSGGVLAYILRTTVLVEEFRGAGIFLAMVKLMVPINGLYWVCLMLRHRISRTAKLLFATHFLLLLVVAAATASRGTILTGFVVLILGYHLLRRPIGGQILVPAAAVLIMVAGILGVVRSNYSVADDSVVLRNTEATDYVELNFTNYGILPVELVLDRPNIERTLGATYLSALTNFIPRALWPEKWTTGGVYLTERFADNKWGGTSYLSTGMITEAIINFGYVAGIVLAFGFFVFAYLLFLSRYPFNAYCRSGRTAGSVALRTFVVINLTLLLAALQFGEFTNLFSQVVTKIGFAVFFFMLYHITRPDVGRVHVTGPGAPARPYAG